MFLFQVFTPMVSSLSFSSCILRVGEYGEHGVEEYGHDRNLPSGEYMIHAKKVTRRGADPRKWFP